MIEQAVIIAGGKGTRLSSITSITPKPLVKIHGKEFIYYLIDELTKYNFKKIIILTGYLHKQFDKFIKDNKKKFKVNIKTFYTDEKYETGKRIFLAKHLLDKNFLLLYGDVIVDINLNDVKKNFLRSKKLLQVLAYNNKDNYSKSNLKLSKAKDVLKYQKNNYSNMTHIDLGYMFINKKVLNFLTKKNVNFEKNIFPKLIKKKQIKAYEIFTRYYSIDDFEKLNRAKNFLEKKKFVFLDRDGVVNIKPKKGEYVQNWKNFKWKSGVLRSFALLKKKNYSVVIVTNQAGIARKKMTLKNFHEISLKMKMEIDTKGGQLLAIYFCPHHWNDNCDCRKPKPGMLIQAQKDFNLKLSECIFFGDSKVDREAALNAGCLFVDVKNDDNLYSKIKKYLK